MEAQLMAYFTRAEISLDLGCLGETDVIVTYLEPEEGDEPEQGWQVENVFLQVGSRLVNIIQIVPEEVIEQIIGVISGSDEEPEEEEETLEPSSDDLLEELSNLGGSDETQTDAQSAEDR